VKTVNGTPMLDVSSSASGTYQDGPKTRSVSGSGKATIPLGRAQAPVGNQLPVTVLNSHTGKADKTPDKEKPSTETLFLDKTQIEQITNKNWYMSLVLTKKTDPRGRTSVVASLDLNKPDGSRTLFKEMPVTFSEKNGYSFTFSGGVVVNPITGVPVIDAKTKKPKIDKYSQVKFTKLLFKKYFGSGPAFIPYWEPAAGGVDYKFLGQKGFGNVFNFELGTT
jgi:hypothetical protein